jgi:hypothetical protein
MAGLSRGSTFSASEAMNAPVQIEGIADFLRDLAKTYPDFNKEARIASQGVAELLVVAATFEAASVTRNRQALEVMKGMRAQRDRIPTIKLQDKSGFVSKSKPNRSRKTKVTRGDVFFGAEFGGGKFGSSNRTSAGARSRATRIDSQGNRVASDGTRKGGGRTTQFLRHRGQSGYFFWPTVRKNKDNIAKVYLNAIDEVLKGLEGKS